MQTLSIPHPPSTRFNEDVDLPPAKRLRRLDSEDASLINETSDEWEGQSASSPGYPERRRPSSEAENDEDLRSTQSTELESALPQVRTDKEAIAEYETSRAAGSTDLGDLYDRLGQRKWIQGKSSIYVDAFNLALETVLDDEAHLFDEAESRVFEEWRMLSYEAQYLYAPSCE